jgi:glycosyltransferase involved in cell wall biosynthesis
MAKGLELISVVIPAYDARSTIARTLESVQNQTHDALEVLVVDNGSSDGTGAIVQEFAARDPRIRLLTSPRVSVGAARNLAFAASRGAFVAPIDADDIWHPDKLALQLQAMRAGGPGVGFVYTFYRRIDMQGGVLYDGGTSGCHGRVYLRQLLGNFVGTGSSLLVRRAAWEDVGGYPADLHEGCEDYLFQILLARHWEVAVVPAFLTGYRLTPGSLSTFRDRMQRAHFSVLETARRRFPETPARILALAEIPNRIGPMYRAALAAEFSTARRELRTIGRIVGTCSFRDLLWVIRYLPGRFASKLDLTARKGWLGLRRGRRSVAPEARVDFYACSTTEQIRPLFARTWGFLKPVVTDQALDLRPRPGGPLVAAGAPSPLGMRRHHPGSG